MTEAAHALISASGFKAMRLCPGKLAMSKGKPDRTSEYAVWGTVAHEWAAELLTKGPGNTAIAWDHEVELEGFTIVKSEEMAECVNTYIKHVWDYVGSDGYPMFENKLNYSQYLGVAEDLAWGTGDAVILRGDEIIVIDLKTGMGVQVDAEDNDQMSLYALGALAQFGDLGDFKRVRMVISQPRISEKPSEWDCSVEDLLEWAKMVATPATRSALAALQTYRAGDSEWESTFLKPDLDACRFCKAKATCPAVRNVVHTTVNRTDQNVATPEEFADSVQSPGKDDTGEWISAELKKVDLIEAWCKAVRAEAERRMFAGEEVPDFKLVTGKRGNRAWANKEEAEAMLKTFRLKQEEMYDLKLISPTKADKLAKEERIGKRQWPKLQALITQADGKPHVAPVSDPRQAFSVESAEAGFEDTTLNDIA